MKKKILILFDLFEDSEDQDYSYELTLDDWESEANVLSALRALGHEVRLFGLCSKLNSLKLEIENFRPDLVFNLSEAFNGDRFLESKVALYLEKLKIPFTGSGSRSLENCKNKASVKRQAKRLGLPTAPFLESKLNSPLSLDRLLKFEYPAFVKPVGLESSQGISKKSLVRNAREAVERVSYLHQKFGQSVLVEKYIEGRDVYVGVLEDARTKKYFSLPPVELEFKNYPQSKPHFATYAAKWNDSYRERWGISPRIAKNLRPQTIRRLSEVSLEIFRALKMTGYARIDFRVDQDENIFLLEANPNPSIAKKDEFALAAKKAGLSYQKLISKIIL